MKENWKFSELEYVRPDFEKVKDNIKASIEKMKAAESFTEALSIYTESEKEINDYFSGLSDSKLIIADKSGGFTTSSTDDYSNPVETTDENGNKELKSFQDKSVAATVGEIKEALKNN